MHRLVFSVKRVHWLWQRQAERLLVERDVWLTPARFTMLRVLHTYRHGICRAKLAQLLGVAAAGVSRMVRTLEAEGLVRRARYDHDRRYVRVALTASGRAVVVDALGEGSDCLDVETPMQRMFASSPHPDVDLEILDRFLIRARVRLRDRALYPVPWHGGEVFWDEPGVITEPPPLDVRVAA